jgi:hypothetical protein
MRRTRHAPPPRTALAVRALGLPLAALSVASAMKIVQVVLAGHVVTRRQDFTRAESPSSFVLFVLSLVAVGVVTGWIGADLLRGASGEPRRGAPAPDAHRRVAGGLTVVGGALALGWIGVVVTRGVMRTSLRQREPAPLAAADEPFLFYGIVLVLGGAAAALAVIGREMLRAPPGDR